MNLIQTLTASTSASFTVVVHVVIGRLARRGSEPERGDVPGWVLITLMTAGLVTILWTLAGNKLAELFTTAIDSVTRP